jgi:beta-glucosidase
VLPPIWVTENGCSYGPSTVDDERIAFLDGHLRALRAAMDAGVDVRGYCCWSLLDNWEWADGFGPRFGLVHVDYATQQRTPRGSYAWYRDLIARTPRVTERSEVTMGLSPPGHGGSPRSGEPG